MLGLAMSTDAFAAALGKGAGMPKPRLVEALRIGLIFGVVEAITPAIGWALGSVASRFIEQWDHWFAFGLLLLLGLHMLYKALFARTDEAEDMASGSMWSIALTGLATSIDAMAVGIGLAFMDVHIGVMAAVIGLCTLTMVTAGIMLGRALGSMVGKRAEIIGGVILVIIGATILYEHLHGVA